MSVMMALGDFQFSMSTAQYQRLKTSMSWRWAKYDRIGRKPGKQYQGPDSDTKSFDIAIYPQSARDLEVMDNLKALGDQGKPKRLIAGALKRINGQAKGSGLDLGLWVLEKLDIDEGEFLDNGIALEIKGSLSISEYGDDEVK
ncbi:phage tail protein [Vibrio parahaemolyticus]